MTLIAKTVTITPTSTPTRTPTNTPTARRRHADEHADEHTDQHADQHAVADRHAHTHADPDRHTACTNCVADSYEQDDTRPQAKPLSMNQISQIHTFHVATDVDWYQIDGLTSGWSYNISTSNLVGSADTYMILYDQGRKHRQDQ